MDDGLSVGSVIEGRYELVRQLGEGGFARVFAARQIHLDRLVAIKILNLSLLNQENEVFERRFLHEAKLAARNGHRNTVTIHEFGLAGPLKQPFIAMEMLEGHDLETEIRRHGPMRPSRAVRLVLPALDALAAGHALGIVHKDLKPANLFISHPSTMQESLIVLDYGVARWEEAGAGEEFTKAGSFNGTPEYIAPEYAKDQIVTPAIDVYQMGLILAEMLTGKPVVQTDSPWGAIMVHVQGHVVLPERVASSPIGPILQRAIAFDHTQRTATTSELLRQLSAVDLEALDRYFGGATPLGAASEDRTEIEITGNMPVVELPPSPIQTAGRMAHQTPFQSEQSLELAAVEPTQTASRPIPIRPQPRPTGMDAWTNSEILLASFALLVLTALGFAIWNLLDTEESRRPRPLPAQPPEATRPATRP